MLESLKLAPLSMDLIPLMAQKPLSPEAPKPLKMMAAKGALPIPPDALIFVWYQLSFEVDPEIQETVKETVRTFDPGLIVDLVQKDLPEHVIDWVAKVTDDNAVLEKIVLNPKTHDATIMDMAANAPKDIIEIIANNHVRLLRSPEIIEKIYNNPSTRMALVDKLLNLAKEHNIEVPGLKTVQDAVSAGDVKDDKPGLSDEQFEEFLKSSCQQSEAEKPQGIENLREAKSIDEQEASETPEENKKRLSRAQLIEQMNAPQRMRLALMGSREDRTILLRDTRRVVYMSVIKSPKMSLSEVTAIAASKSMPDEIINYVSTRRDWIRYYPIVVALVNNPKTPLSESVGLMKQLRVNDLKMLAKSKAVPAQLARQAQMLFKQKSTR